MKRKAVELSFNVMIIAALSLAVFVVLIITFTSEAGYFSKNTVTCESKGGNCMLPEDCQFEKMYTQCPKKGDKSQICCINPYGETK